MAFNLMDIMNSSSQGEALKYEPAEIDIENICANPANDIYNTEDIDKLAESIELAGRVLQNLVVKAADEEGHYMIISGHRRWLACRKLVEGGNEQYRTLPCLIEHEHDDLLQELMLIYSNSTIRVLTDPEKMRQASRATEICRRLKEENRLEGRVRDIVAGMLNESASQLARYSAIDKNLVNEDLRQKFDEGELGVSAAYEASKLSEESQQKLAEENQDSTITLQKVNEVKEQEQEAAIPADPAEPPAEEFQSAEPGAEEKTKMRPRGELLQAALSDVVRRLEKLSNTAASLAKVNEEEHKEEEAIIEKMKVDYYNRLLGLIRQEQTTIG